MDVLTRQAELCNGGLFPEILFVDPPKEDCRLAAALSRKTSECDVSKYTTVEEIEKAERANLKQHTEKSLPRGVQTSRKTT